MCCYLKRKDYYHTYNLLLLSSTLLNPYCCIHRLSYTTTPYILRPQIQNTPNHNAQHHIEYKVLTLPVLQCHLPMVVTTQKKSKKLILEFNISSRQKYHAIYHIPLHTYQCKHRDGNTKWNDVIGHISETYAE